MQLDKVLQLMPWDRSLNPDYLSEDIKVYNHLNACFKDNIKDMGVESNILELLEQIISPNLVDEVKKMSKQLNLSSTS